MKRILPLIFILFLLSCSKKDDYKNSSRATGWKMIGRMGGFAKNYNKKTKEQETGPGLVFIEGGTFTMGRVQDDPMGDWNNIPNQQHVMSFYIDETEVTNLMYLEYLDWLKRVFPPDDENYGNIYASALPDTLAWRNPLGFNEAMVKNYLRHPAFSEYPVVGVSWLQAVNFCKWRADRVNEKLLEDADFTALNARLNITANQVFSTETYLKTPTSAYGGNDSILNGGKRSSRLVELKRTVPFSAPRILTFICSAGMGFFYLHIDFQPKLSGSMQPWDWTESASTTSTRAGKSTLGTGNIPVREKEGREVTNWPTLNKGMEITVE